MIPKILKKGQVPTNDRKQIAEAILEMIMDDLKLLDGFVDATVRASCSVYINITFNTNADMEKAIKKITKKFAKSINCRVYSNKDVTIYIDRDFTPKIDIPYQALI